MMWSCEQGRKACWRWNWSNGGGEPWRKGPCEMLVYDVVL